MEITNSTIIGGNGEYTGAPNGNGSTSFNVALAVTQHTTKLPIKITVNSGTFSANAAFVQANPQKNGQEDIDKVTLEINGGDFNGLVYSENKTRFISGGNFTHDPSEYVSEGYIAGDSDNSSYTYQVVEKTNSETPAEVVPAAPAVDTGDLSKEEATAVSTALANAEAELTAAANTQADQNTVTNDEAKTALEDALISTSDKNVTVVIQPYLDITVKDYNIAETTKVLSLDITPMYRTVATTVDVENNPDGIKVKGDAGVMAMPMR